MPEYVSYILSFLINADATSASEVIKNICYTEDKKQWKNYKIVIIPSGFFDKISFGTQASAPKLPLKEIEGTPLLYGSPEVVKLNDQLIVKADIVASSFFLLTRYEELINTERDKNGRFLGKSSILYRCGALQRAVVDEYGALLRGWLKEVGVDIPKQYSKFRKVISHDVDHITQYRTVRGFAGGVKRFHFIDAIKSNLFGAESDPLFTFSWMHTLEEGIDTELFIKVAGNKLPQDMPYYNPFSNDVKRVLELYPNPGIHISYEASKNSSLIKAEVELLSKIAGKKITKSRHHFLASLHPEDMQALIDAGIEDDYTMGYADEVGFRLGTSRAVRWINPRTKELTKLTLHPLIVMDRTLYDARYMNLNYNDSVSIYKELLSQCKKYGGEFVTLWHNSEVSSNNNSYARSFFQNIVTKNEDI